MNKNRAVKTVVILAMLGLTLGLAAVGVLGLQPLGDPLDGVGALFGRLGVEPLGDPFDGGILFKGGKGGPVVSPLGDPFDGGILF